jgi:hypothetical protein
MFISIYVERFAPSRRGEAVTRRVEANGNFFWIGSPASGENANAIRYRGTN